MATKTIMVARAVVEATKENPNPFWYEIGPVHKSKKGLMLNMAAVPVSGKVFITTKVITVDETSNDSNPMDEFMSDF